MEQAKERMQKARCFAPSGADQNPDSVWWEVLELVFFGIYLLDSWWQW